MLTIDTFRDFVVARTKSKRMADVIDRHRATLGGVLAEAQVPSVTVGESFRDDLLAVRALVSGADLRPHSASLRRLESRGAVARDGIVGWKITPTRSVAYVSGWLINRKGMIVATADKEAGERAVEAMNLIGREDLSHDDRTGLGLGTKSAGRRSNEQVHQMLARFGESRVRKILPAAWMAQLNAGRDLPLPLREAEHAILDARRMLGAVVETSAGSDVETLPEPGEPAVEAVAEALKQINRDLAPTGWQLLSVNVNTGSGFARVTAERRDRKTGRGMQVILQRSKHGAHILEERSAVERKAGMYSDHWSVAQTLGRRRWTSFADAIAALAAYMNDNRWQGSPPIAARALRPLYAPLEAEAGTEPASLSAGVEVVEDHSQYPYKWSVVRGDEVLQRYELKIQAQRHKDLLGGDLGQAPAWYQLLLHRSRRRLGDKDGTAAAVSATRLLGLTPEQVHADRDTGEPYDIVDQHVRGRLDRRGEYDVTSKDVRPAVSWESITPDSLIDGDELLVVDMTTAPAAVLSRTREILASGEHRPLLVVFRDVGQLNYKSDLWLLERPRG